MLLDGMERNRGNNHLELAFRRLKEEKEHSAIGETGDKDDCSNVANPSLRIVMRKKRQRISTSNKSRRHWVERLVRRLPPLRIALVTTSVISVLAHTFVLKGISLHMDRETVKQEAVKKIELARTQEQIPKEPPPSKQEIVQPVKKKAPPPPRKKAPKSLSSAELKTLGEKFQKRFVAGAFPSLSLSYESPTTYVREIYALGGKTLVHDKLEEQYYDIDLFHAEYSPVSAEDFVGFSKVKREILDREWDYIKQEVARQLDTPRQMLEILLLLPMELENLWLGKQVAEFERMGLAIDRIATVEAVFKQGTLKLSRILLKDGSSRVVKRAR